MIHLIYLEGIDNTGKTTTWNTLKQYEHKLSLGFDKVIFVYEPFSSDLTDRIKALNKADNSQENQGLIQSLFLEDRLLLYRNLQYYTKVHKNLLVISDRSMFSSYAYGDWDNPLSFLVMHQQIMSQFGFDFFSPQVQLDVVLFDTVFTPTITTSDRLDNSYTNQERYRQRYAEVLQPLFLVSNCNVISIGEYQSSDTGLLCRHFMSDNYPQTIVDWKNLF